MVIFTSLTTHHLPPVKEFTPLIPPPSEAGLFEKDDLEFRTITTILHSLGTRERITLDNFQVSRENRSRLKLLAALSSLLVRDLEIIAVMPKRSVRGSTLFIGSASKTATETAFHDDEPTTSSASSASSASSSSSQHNYITRNPRYRDPVGPIQLLNSPAVVVGSDVFDFILQNWDQPFEHHVQSFANLLNKALDEPDDDNARVALDMYSLFQSAPKIHRRINHSLRLKQLIHLQPRFNTTHVPSHKDEARMDAILILNGSESHTLIDEFLRHRPTDPQAWLHEFHKFFTWFLKIIIQEVEKLKKLRASKSIPAALPVGLINHAYNNLAALQFFSWKSRFFQSYIHEAFATGIRDSEKIYPEVVTEGFPCDPDQDVLPERPQENVEEESEAMEEEDMGLDISTEFETGEEQASVRVTSDEIDPCLLELRLMSSNIQHVDMLLSGVPRSRFRFQIIQYAPSGKSLKPWRELIEELFPEPELAQDILQALEKTDGKQFDCFRPGGPVLKFKGQAHCEAVLGCLFSITKRDEDNTWAGISKSVLRAIGTCYSLLAPSKRCCPVCAAIISFLSEEAVQAGGMGIHALSKHSVTFPCALPVGLPGSVRQKLLNQYRDKLRAGLVALLPVSEKRSLSTGSGQSAMLSQDGDSKSMSLSQQKRLLRVYQSDWGVVDEFTRKERWEKAGQNLTLEQLQSWWAEMNEDMKVGLLAPVQVEKAVSMPEITNLALESEAQT